jgi:hypothetical protein
VEADYLVHGKINEKPYKAYICNEHIDMYLMDDGNYLNIIEYISDNAKNELTKELTGFNTFNELCINNPTLRYNQSDTKEFKNKIQLLRKYYSINTGKKANN